MRFNSFELKAPSSYGPIPVGNYDAQVSFCEWRENNQHTGEIIAVKYTIIGPTHSNRIVFSNFNIRNSSAKAEEIGSSSSPTSPVHVDSKSCRMIPMHTSGRF